MTDCLIPFWSNLPKTENLATLPVCVLRVRDVAPVFKATPRVCCCWKLTLDWILRLHFLFSTFAVRYSSLEDAYCRFPVSPCGRTVYTAGQWWDGGQWWDRGQCYPLSGLSLDVRLPLQQLGSVLRVARHLLQRLDLPPHRVYGG